MNAIRPHGSQAKRLVILYGIFCASVYALLTVTVWLWYSIFTGALMR